MKLAFEGSFHGSRSAMACIVYPIARRAAVFLGLSAVVVTIPEAAVYAGQKLYNMEQMFKACLSR